MLEGTLFAGRCSLKKKAASLKLQAASRRLFLFI
jgi:hypothetical protein